MEKIKYRQQFEYHHEPGMHSCMQLRVLFPSPQQNWLTPSRHSAGHPSQQAGHETKGGLKGGRTQAV